VLKCTASQFARQFAYQYSITDRSADPVDVEWDLVENMRAKIKPAVQAIPSGKTYLFLTDIAPKEAEGRIVVRTRSGVTAGTFRLDGFVINPR
jgi:hypothetical protein